MQTRTATLGAHDNPTVGSSLDFDSMEIFTAQTDEGMRTLIRVLEIELGATGSAGIRVRATLPQITGDEKRREAAYYANLPPQSLDMWKFG